MPAQNKVRMTGSPTEAGVTYSAINWKPCAEQEVDIEINVQRFIRLSNDFSSHPKNRFDSSSAGLPIESPN